MESASVDARLFSHDELTVMMASWVQGTAAAIKNGLAGDTEDILQLAQPFLKFALAMGPFGDLRESAEPLTIFSSNQPQLISI